MDASLTIRTPTLLDVAELARLHVRAWQETYRGVVADEFLDHPDAVERRERFWTAVLSDPRAHERRAALAERDGRVRGLGLSGPAIEPGTTEDTQLYALYVGAEAYGGGIGTALLEAVLDPTDSAYLWVAEPNPRAQRFYQARGFRFDGAERVDDGVRERRMVRSAG